MASLKINSILAYRFLCLILALGYWLYQFSITNYDNFGIQFRFLTIWGPKISFGNDS